jgi:hypothetical protein
MGYRLERIFIVQGNLYLKTGADSKGEIGDNCCFKSGRGTQSIK